MSTAETLQQMSERHAGVIAELTGLLMDAARQCGADVAQAETPEARAQAYDRLPGLARAVRLCLAQEGRVVRDGLRDVRLARAADHEDREAQAAARQAERRARKTPVWDRVMGALEDAFGEDDENDNAAYYERYEDLRTRLDDETFEAEFAHLPYEEAVRVLCRDLKLPEPQFGPQDRVRALIWAAQWGHPPPEPAPEAAHEPAPELPPQAPEPQPPQPYFRYSSG